MTSAAAAGVLVVDKALGMTSFDVVALVRRRIGVSRIGHAGTLDPDASGVLPVLIGEATKLMPWLLDHEKEYAVTLRLGVRTDTHDLGGQVLSTAPVPGVDRTAVEAASRPFVGRVQQIPPMFSAVHHQGRRLYELAREGREVERKAREVVIHAIDVEVVTPPTVGLRVVCGRGTYIRTLVADLGEVLGCGAAVERLVRTRVGAWTLSEALAASSIAGLDPEAVWGHARPAASALAHWAEVPLAERAAAAFVHGQTVSCAVTGLADTTLVRVTTRPDRFLGVGELSSGGTKVRPVRILHADRPRPSPLHA